MFRHAEMPKGPRRVPTCLTTGSKAALVHGPAGRSFLGVASLLNRWSELFPFEILKALRRLRAAAQVGRATLWRRACARKPLGSFFLLQFFRLL